MTKHTRTSLFLIAALCIPAAASSAEAQADGAYFGFGLGPSIGIGDNNGGTMFKLEESLGFHILSHGVHPGLFIAPVLTQAFEENHARFSFAVRGGYDIQLWTNGKLRLLATPMMSFGFALHAFPDTGADARGFFNFGFGGDVRLVLPGEKLTIWGRPLAFEFDANDGVVKYYDFLFGININF